ncbi:MAG: hypothetical protein DLD55_01670 [candidate division SR1 bacterium]|nr:MAG: hypothetical protein DLD55_01670 [candidate division SR1 bacterium]
MGKSNFFNFTLSDLWKLIGLTLICFLALHLYFWKFGAQESMIQVDYFTQEEKRLDQTFLLLGEYHLRKREKSFQGENARSKGRHRRL